MPPSKNFSVVFNEGYIAGYNQSRVDAGLMPQEKADHILKQMSSVDETETTIENAANLFMNTEARNLRKSVTGRR